MRWLVRLVARIAIIAGLMLAIDKYLPFLLRVEDVAGAVLAAALLALANSTIRPIFMFVATPLNFFTIGFFTLVVDAFVLEIVSVVTAGAISTQGFLYTVGAAFIISLLSTLILTLFLGTES